MVIRKLVTISIYVVAASVISTGTVHAEPSSDRNVPGIGFTATSDGRAATIAIDAGSLLVEDGALKIEASDGTVLVDTALTFRVDDFEFPIAAQISDRTATLAPQYDIAHAVYKPASLPFEDKAPWKNEYDREQAAWSRMTSTITTGATIGTLVGGLGGAAVGCVLGGIAGATIAAATIVGLFGPFVPAATVGCIGGIIAVGALGTIAGQILVTAPVAALAAIQYFTTINSPMPMTK
ncbi:hypothetical protein [Nocardia aurantiaca]|uniref:DUF8020 domain-containing protein n=1 Tax=Nocardia aurantiaca TaxID=2675850 RepID=A0A6I3L1E8_9NOCA|nr:hypothetical protein [Nocardia aurantiaca]MTE16813.1 hypothetical protein [Nocardia aurantiaca]